jgi:hypothetical protein
MMVGLTVLLVTSAPASAATYYVDNSGSPACSNSLSAGSEARPLCTINFGVGILRGGDELVVKRGTYNEAVYIDGPAGTAAQPTVIRTYPGHVVTIRGTGNTGRVKITSTSYLTFDGFVVTNFNQGIFVEGGAHHITIQNCVVHDVGQDGIHVRQNSSYVTIQGCAVYNTERIGGCCNGEGIYVGAGSAGPLDNSHHVTVRNNTIHHVTHEGIEFKPGTHHNIAENNDIYAAGLAWSGKCGVAFGMGIEVNERDLGEQTWSGNPSHIIRNNRVHDMDCSAIRLGTGSTAYNNVVWNINVAGQDGIRITNPNGDSFPRLVYHNTVAMRASDAITQSGSPTTDIRNNIGPTAGANLPFDPSSFVNAAAGDFHLVAGAAAIDAGRDLGELVTTDKDGKDRPVGVLPDMGAFEFSMGAVPAAPRGVRIVATSP